MEILRKPSGQCPWRSHIAHRADFVHPRDLRVLFRSALPFKHQYPTRLCRCNRQRARTIQTPKWSCHRRLRWHLSDFQRGVPRWRFYRCMPLGTRLAPTAATRSAESSTVGLAPRPTPRAAAWAGSTRARPSAATGSASCGATRSSATTTTRLTTTAAALPAL